MCDLNYIVRPTSMCYGVLGRETRRIRCQAKGKRRTKQTSKKTRKKNKTRTMQCDAQVPVSFVPNASPGAAAHTHSPPYPPLAVEDDVLFSRFDARRLHAMPCYDQPVIQRPFLERCCSHRGRCSMMLLARSPSLQPSRSILLPFLLSSFLCKKEGNPGTDKEIEN